MEPDFFAELRKLSKIKEQVRYIYETYPETTRDYNLLEYKYLEVYHNLVGQSYRYVVEYIQRNKISRSSIRRYGRWWRRKWHLPMDDVKESAHYTTFCEEGNQGGVYTSFPPLGGDR